MRGPAAGVRYPACVQPRPLRTGARFPKALVVAEPVRSRGRGCTRARVLGARAGRVTALLAALALGCHSGGPRHGAEGNEDPRDYVGKDAQVDFGTLVFTDPAERARFERARVCLGERGREWEHFPLRMIGNFVEEGWCRGPGAERGCEGGGFRREAGVDWASVGTLHYPKDWPQVFGVQVSAGHVPADGSLGVWVSVSSNGKSILGDGGTVGFGRAGDEEELFYVGTQYTWQIAESRWVEEVEGDGWELLDRVRSSPQALREEALTHWTALERTVIAALERGEAVECVYGEYAGDGIPPPCLRKVPISAEAVAEQTARIRAKVAGVRAAVEGPRGEELHAALVTLAPVGCI